MHHEGHKDHKVYLFIIWIGQELSKSRTFDTEYLLQEINIKSLVTFVMFVSFVVNIIKLTHTAHGTAESFQGVRC